MKRVVLAFLLLVTFAVAATNCSLGDDTVAVRVTASRMVIHHAYFQQLSVLIDGKQYELESELPIHGLLALRDYNARLVKDRKSEYEAWQVYEFLLPDNTTRRFVVMEIRR